MQRCEALATSSAEGVHELTDKFADEFGAAGLSGEETAVIYEQSMNTGFGQSCRGFFLLKFLGYPKVKVLHGGYQAWTAEGMPVSTEAVTPAPKTFPITDTGHNLMLDVADVQAALGDDKIVMLDVRDVDEWIADSSSPYGKDFCPRKGRLPGARWIEWYRMMKPSAEGPMIKSKDEILAECATVGIKADTPVYIYCFKGARASNTFLAIVCHVSPSTSALRRSDASAWGRRSSTSCRERAQLPMYVASCLLSSDPALSAPPPPSLCARA